ncbi:MAG: TraB/GumN family protein [Sphingomonadales bacterium]|nr:MAG: TraB/GumN family protein [Sphingomonadales bacterium]
MCVDRRKARHQPSAMGRIAWGLAATALAIATAAVAQNVPGLVPALPYIAYAPDDRLALSGKPVREESDALYDAAYRRELARVATAQPYDPAPAIWKISDADTSIYLFGTVHSLPPGFRWRNPGLESVIVRADSLILESVDDDHSDVTFLEGLPQDGALPPLIDRVSHRSRAKLAELQAVLPAQVASDLDKMPSWIAAMSIATVRDLMAGDIPSQGADDWLEKHFRSLGRPVHAIEDSKEVVSNINTVPESAQRMMLEAALLVPLRTHDELDAVAHAWARGQVGADSPLRILPESIDPGAQMADPLLTRRNHAWADSLVARLKAQPGVILFAAGAAHFVGPESVIDLLARRGLRVERVQ